MAHGKLHLICALIFAVAGSLTADDSVEIPAVFYFGRWASGHQFTAARAVTSDESPYWEYSYSFTNEALRVKFDSLFSYVLWDEELGAPAVDLFWRPAGNIQLAVMNLYSRSREDTELATNPEPRISIDRNRRFGGTARIALISRDTLHLSEHQAVYSYFVSDIVNSGEFLYDGRVNFSRTASDISWSSIRTSSTGSINESFARQSDYTRIDLQSDLTYGLTAQINTHGRVSWRSRWTDTDRWQSRRYNDSIVVLKQSESESYQGNLYYSLRATANPLRSMYFNLGFEQALEFGTDDFSQTEFINDSVRSLSEGSLSYPLESMYGVFSLKADYLTTGEFVSSILLDDYSGFYRRMLFKGQTHISIDSRYFRDKDGHRKNFLLYTEGRYGLSNKLNAGVNARYTWSEREPDKTTMQTLRSDLMIRYRSYPYEPGAGPGWEQDSPLDIAYGPILEFGQWTASLSTDLLCASPGSSLPAAALEFDNLNFDWRLHTYYLTQQIGVGRSVALELNEEVRFEGSSLGKLHILYLEYDIGVLYRPLPHAQLRLRLQDAYYKFGERSAVWWFELEALI